MMFNLYQADWKALRGALVGCLALVKRKSSGGAVTANDAKAIAESFAANVQVQSFAQQDRMVRYYTTPYLIYF